MKRQFIISVILGLLAINLFAQSEKKMVREGNSQFEEGKFSEAEIEYRKALDKKPGYFKGTFNLGDAMYEQENYEESGKLFAEVAEGVHPDAQKADAWYNLGNSLMSQQKYQESIEAYKNALRLKPDDQDAKYNLAYAQKKLKEQQQQQQNQEQNKDKNKDQDKDKQKQDKKDQDKKDQDKNQDKDKQDQNKDKQDQQDQNKDNKDQGDQQKDKNQQPQPQQISKEDAQRMLEALKNDEKKTLQELQKQKAKAAKSKKTDIDW
jgi:tetratricopeptide (TPR) repeat protein